MSGYIGNIPVPQATQTRDTFTATAGQTSFTASGYTPTFLDVYLNGVHLQDGTDYTAGNGSDVVLTTGAALGDVLEVVAFTTFELVETNGSAKSWVNFNGTGTVVIRDSLNGSSITDGGTGTYTVNFTNNMSSANHSSCVSSANTVTNAGQDHNASSPTSSSYYFQKFEGSTLRDTNIACTVTHGDLA
jgi:hypothetical protein